TVAVVAGDSPAEAVGKQVGAATVAMLRRLTGSGVRRGQRAGEPVPLPEFLPGARSWIALPLATPDAAVGLLVIRATADDGYTDAHAGIVATLAGQAMIAYDKALAFQRVQQLATQDGLTGVANRRHLLEQAEHQFTGAEP